ncbi:hypothetical protein GGX14DRAFT_467189 [Mycena pura]|uniref:DUF6534 domain-containing protein n=1 Tax=Mycena pura TaxID=153505 RepID=A0AAD6Y3W4_9AGAR|nr:hypothetical protein GGX14DRAFT_467189 [Mycena pura]
MSTASPLPAPGEIAQQTGPVIIGYLLHWGLFGALTIQLYLYYEAFPLDRLPIKVLVYTVYIIEFVQTMLMTYDAFGTFGYGFGANISVVTNVHFDWLCIPIMGGTIGFLVQSFYAHRIYVFSESKVIPTFIVFVSLVSVIAGFLSGAVSHRTSELSHLRLRSNHTAAAVWNAGTALCDIIIAGCLTYHLSKHDTQYRRTHLLILKLIRLTIVTGSLTALVAITNLVLFLIPGEIYFTSAGAVQTKLYANAMYAVLISRFQIVGGRGYSPSIEFVSTAEFRDNPRTGSGNAHSQQSVVVTIRREVFAERELDELVMTRCINVKGDSASTVAGDNLSQGSFCP